MLPVFHEKSVMPAGAFCSWMLLPEQREVSEPRESVAKVESIATENKLDFIKHPC